MSRLVLKDKDANFIPLDLDAPFAWAQKEFLAEVERQRRARRPVRILVLKGRQIGISTATEGILFNWCFVYPGSNCLVLSRSKEQSEYLFKMTKTFWERSEIFYPLFHTERANIRQLSWAETKSNFQVETAKGKEVGRGTTVHALHASEVAFWDNAEDLMAPLINAIPNTPRSIVVLESTANGVGGFFYDEWMKAVKNESEYTAMFFPWWRHSEYQIAKHSLKESLLDEEERYLVSEFKLSLAQLAWRRRQISLNNGDVDLFHQEYPTTWQEAFLSTGTNVFHLDSLDECFSPPGTEDRHGQRVGMSVGRLDTSRGPIRFVEEYDGNLKIFKHPDPKKRYQYVIGADPSRTTYGDPGCIQVLNRATLEQVAVWRGHASQDELATMIAALGHYYHEAIVNCEIEGGGAGVIAVLQHLQYPNIWRWRRPDAPLHKRGNVFGWSTNTRTKPWMIGEVKDRIYKRILSIHDDATYHEMREYVVLNGVEMGPASNQGHDDTVTSLAIALMTALTEDPVDFAKIYQFPEAAMIPSETGFSSYDGSQMGELEF